MAYPLWLGWLEHLHSSRMRRLFQARLYTKIEHNSPVFRSRAKPKRDKYLHAVWHPYHAKIRTTLDALKQRYGYAVLFDAHSIRSVIPRLFDGTLPHFNIGTNDSRSLTPSLETSLQQVCRSATAYSTIVNGRFKGGYTTRQYGDPNNGIQAVQLELAQRTYMNEAPPFNYQPEKAAQAQRVLHPFVTTLLDWRPSR